MRRLEGDAEARELCGFSKHCGRGGSRAMWMLKHNVEARALQMWRLDGDVDAQERLM